MKYILATALVIGLFLTAQQNTNVGQPNNQHRIDNAANGQTGHPADEANPQREQPDQSQEEPARNKPVLSLGSTACPPDSEKECREKQLSLEQRSLGQKDHQ